MVEHTGQTSKIDKLVNEIINEEREEAYQQGMDDRESEIIKILENHWLSGGVARRIIDEIIDQIKGEKNEETNRTQYL